MKRDLWAPQSHFQAYFQGLYEISKKLKIRWSLGFDRNRNDFVAVNITARRDMFWTRKFRLDVVSGFDNPIFLTNLISGNYFYFPFLFFFFLQDVMALKIFVSSMLGILMIIVMFLMM